MRRAASLLRRASSLRCRDTTSLCSGAREARQARDGRRWQSSSPLAPTTIATSTSSSSPRSFASAGIATAAAAAAALALALPRPSCEPASERGSGEGTSTSSSAPPPPCPLCDAAPWVLSLSTSPETKEILSAEALAASARSAGPESRSKAPAFVGGDHMFSALLRHDLVRDLVALYQPQQKKMRYIIQLGEDVCGYARVVHGGLTAAIVDESMGFLFYALRSHGELPFRGPAFTASLKIDYRRMIHNDGGRDGRGKLLLVTAEVERCEGRKLWMRATVTDGPGVDARVYAEGTALFVSPSAAKLAKEAAKYVASYVMPGTFE